ncbi:MAG: helix-hairpin-helix domain-containing protein [Lachnospirales bacterium]
MKKIILVTICFILICSTYVYGKSSYISLSGGEEVYVKEVIDANAYLVTYSGNEALVKIQGIDVNGYDKAYETMKSMLTSQKVYYVDGYYDGNDRWNYGNLTYNNKEIATFLIEMGLAKVDDMNLSSNDKKYYNALEKIAEDNGYNMWESKDNYTVVSTNGININTASKSFLVDELKLSSNIASSIIEYRKYNPFNNVAELKFVPRVTKDIYDDIYKEVVVATNINTASLYELQSISSLSSSNIDKIAEAREKDELTKAEFYDLELFSNSKYAEIIDFVYFDGSKTTIDTVVPSNIVVNINMASSEQIEEIGLSSTTSPNIAKQMKDTNFIYHNFEELSKLSNVTSLTSSSNLYKYSDNISFVTNINEASENEIASLYGEYADEYANKVKELIANRPYTISSSLSGYFPSEIYDKVKDVIVFDDETDYLNINLSKDEALKKLGLSNSEISKIDDERKYSSLDSDLDRFANEITLYTNINNASKGELISISDDFDESFIYSLFSYREKENFGKLEEVEDFFDDNDKLDLYEDIEEFLTVQ